LRCDAYIGGRTRPVDRIDDVLADGTLATGEAMITLQIARFIRHGNAY
jgi:hypothetical protein